MIENVTKSRYCLLYTSPQYQLTQRPDKAASGLMEGRIVLVVDNSPEVIVLPVTLNIFFQASDDYYNRCLLYTSC